MAQAAIVGEVEWNWKGGEVDKDFEKLLIADSLVLFMTFQSPSVENGKMELERLEAAARRRQQYARMRGLNRPPIFLLSCWCWTPTGAQFEHRIVRPSNELCPADGPDVRA